MRKWLLLLSFLTAASVHAQTTSVSATAIKDANGNLYANGTVSAFLVVPSGVIPRLAGVPVNPSSGPFAIDSTGSFTISLSDNGQVVPAGTKWIFGVCGSPVNIGPATPGGKVCFSTASATITGATQDVTALINASASLIGPPTTGFGIPGASVNSFAGASQSDYLCVLSVSPLIVGPCTPGIPPNVQSSGTYTIAGGSFGVRGDRGGWVVRTNTVACSDTLPAAGSGVSPGNTGFGSKFYFTYLVWGTAGCTLNVTAPSQIKVNGAALASFMTLDPGQVAFVEGDDTNYSAIVQNNISGWYSVKTYGAKGNGTTDDTTAIQAAIDAAQAAAAVVGGNTGAPIVWFPPGNYVFTAQLVKKSARWYGAGANSGTRLTWKGAVGAIAIDQSVSFFGGSSVGGIYGIEFGNEFDVTAVKPLTWLQLHFSDALYFIEDFQFFGSTGDAISLVGGAAGGWVNFRLRRGRFDGIQGYCVRSVVGPSQNQSSWSIQDFTVDSKGFAVPGIFAFDNTSANVTSASVVMVSNARIESSASWGTNAGLISMLSGAATNPNFLSILLSDLNVQIGTGATLVRSDTTIANVTFIPDLVATNVNVAGISNIFSSPNGWWVNAAQLPIGSSPINITSSTNTHEAQFVGAPITGVAFDGNDPNGHIIRVRTRIDAANRFVIAGDGRLRWGDGTNPLDTNLQRNGVGALLGNGTLAENAFLSTTANPAATGAVRLASGDSACWRNAANSADICISKNASDQILLNGTVATASFNATSASLGGAALVAGQCSTNTTTVTGATTAMVAIADPTTYPGDGAFWDATVTAANTVTTKVCAVVALTPTASTYLIKVFTQ